MKNLDKDTLKELALGLSEIILLIFVVYFIVRDSQDSISLVDLIPIFISAMLGAAYMGIYSHSEIDSDEDFKIAESRFRKAVNFVILGYLFLALALFISKKEVGVTTTEVRQVDATIVNISKDTVLLSSDGSFEGVKDVTNVNDLTIGDKVTTISHEDKVTNFKSWTGLTSEVKEKLTTLKGN